MIETHDINDVAPKGSTHIFDAKVSLPGCSQLVVKESYSDGMPVTMHFTAEGYVFGPDDLRFLAKLFKRMAKNIEGRGD
jgi:hypothetical protein